MNTKKIQFIFIAIVASLLFTGCSRLQTSTPSETSLIESAPVEVDGKKKAEYEFVAAEDDQVALDLIMANAEVETTDYGDAGKFVTSINGLAGDNSYYWAFYLNGEYAEKGASQTILKKGDTIKFVYEAVTVTQEPQS